MRVVLWTYYLQTILHDVIISSSSYEQALWRECIREAIVSKTKYRQDGWDRQANAQGERKGTSRSGILSLDDEPANDNDLI